MNNGSEKVSETLVLYPSNDSEVIAEYLSRFEYDASKTEEVLSRYNDLLEKDSFPKKLKP